MDERRVPDDQLLTRLGMTELPVALALADVSLRRLWRAGRDAVERVGEHNESLVVLMGLLARGQGFHEGVLHAVRNDNPYAAFTLLRAYAENAAALAYLGDQPEELPKFFTDPVGHGVSVGRLTAHADKHFDGFKSVYRTLSDQ